jgi:hypothetical protein
VVADQEVMVAADIVVVAEAEEDKILDSCCLINEAREDFHGLFDYYTCFLLINYF